MSLPTDFIAEPDLVVPDLEVESGEQAVQALHARLTASTNAVMDAPRFLSDLIQRMRLASVCVAEDVALAHARTSAVGRTVLGVGRCSRGIAFDGGHPRVRLIFLIGTPKRAVAEYLQVVSVLSRLLRDPAVRAGLYSAPDESEIRALLAGGVVAQR